MTFYQNEDGEYIMSPEQIRAEWAADERDAYERMAWDEDFYADYPEPECDGDEHCTTDADQRRDGSWECAACGETVPEPADWMPYPMEDQWLDGSYEQ